MALQAVGWLEIHAEKYKGGGPGIRALERLRGDHAIAVHGVGLSLGSADGLDRGYLSHLLPLPYTARRWQTPSSYLRSRDSPIPEVESISASRVVAFGPAWLCWEAPPGARAPESAGLLTLISVSPDSPQCLAYADATA